MSVGPILLERHQRFFFKNPASPFLATLEWHVFRKDFDTIGLIGYGEFGKVFQALWGKTPDHCLHVLVPGMISDFNSQVVPVGQTHSPYVEQGR